jgi:hypothetical protein
MVSLGPARMGLVLLGLVAATAATPAEELELRNDVLELRLDAASGAIQQVRDLVHGLELVREPGLAPAFRLQGAAGRLDQEGEVSATPDTSFDGTAFDLAWATSDARVTVHGRIELGSGDAPARFRVRAASDGGPRLDWIEYPVIAGVGPLGSDPGRSELILPFATGYRIVDPLAHLGPGDRLGYYPNGYGGAPLQLLAYLERDVGGFHFQVEDAGAEAKRLDGWVDGGTGWLEITVRRLSPDARAGRPLAPAGDVVLAVNRSGTWEESADRYRAWTLAQPWAAVGPLRDRPEHARARWLLEEVGVATFGISVNLDQAAWFSGLSDLLDVPLFHVSGFWWPGGTEISEWYGGYNDWADDRVSPANLDAIRAAGDRFALFHFPQHFSRDVHEYHNPAPDPATDPVAPWSPYAMSPDPQQDPWSFMCPATTEWQDFFGWRNVELMTRHQPDAEYLDIGPGLGEVHCERGAHGHPPGWGPSIVAGTQAMLDSRRGELHALHGSFVPRGTEMISELYLDRFEFYQARAGGGPLSMLEGDHFRWAEVSGWAEKIPLFGFVYHDYGPVRLDGNLKLAPELGELFAWVAARVVLWGGIPELNYELSALERLDGTGAFTWFETYRGSIHCLDTTPYGTDPTKVELLRELSDLRTRRGTAFLAYGRMRRSPAFSVAPATVELDWHLYNTFHRDFDCDDGWEQGAEYDSHGTMVVPAVLATAWSAPAPEPPGGVARRERFELAYALAEVGGAARTARPVLDPARQDELLLNFHVTARRRGGDDDLGLLQAGAGVDLPLAPHEAVLLVLAPSPCEAPDCRYRVFRSSDPRLVGQDDTALSDAVGHAYSDDTAADGRTWFYLVDDGGGYPTDTLRLQRSTTIDLSW